MKLKGLKKAVGDFQRFNSGGKYSPEYGYLMLDRSTGELWTDYFYSVGHNSWKQYHDNAIINLVTWADRNLYPLTDMPGITMANVRDWAEAAIIEYDRTEKEMEEHDR